MDRLINKDEALKCTAMDTEIYSAINMLPAVDAVPVVRCKNCKWYKGNYTWNGVKVKVCVRESYEPIRRVDDFCSYGEES